MTVLLELHTRDWFTIDWLHLGEKRKSGSRSIQAMLQWQAIMSSACLREHGKLHLYKSTQTFSAFSKARPENLSLLLDNAHEERTKLPMKNNSRYPVSCNHEQARNQQDTSEEMCIAVPVHIIIKINVKVPSVLLDERTVKENRRQVQQHPEDKIMSPWQASSSQREKE